MARAHRHVAAGALYHGMSRGVDGQRIYRVDDDFERFIRLLLIVERRFRWVIHAYCLMPNHYHLVLETPFANLSAGLQRLNWRHALRFNWRHGHTGHLFESRFHSELIETDAHLLEAARYVVLNPVRAGLCRHPAQWPFSSYRSTLDAASDPSGAYSRILGQFGSEPQIVRARYEAFVAEGVASGRGPVPGTRTRLDQPKPYVPAKRFASSRTSAAAGRPTTLR